jgi:hypothetical protein
LQHGHESEKRAVVDEEVKSVLEHRRAEDEEAEVDVSGRDIEEHTDCLDASVDTDLGLQGGFDCINIRAKPRAEGMFVGTECEFVEANL